MNDINDITIATLIVGLCLLLITLFIVVVGFESRLEKVLSHVIDGRFMMKTLIKLMKFVFFQRLAQCLYATFYIVVLILIVGKHHEFAPDYTENRTNL